jgi:hypothetical protein
MCCAFARKPAVATHNLRMDWAEIRGGSRWQVAVHYLAGLDSLIWAVEG